MVHRPSVEVMDEPYCTTGEGNLPAAVVHGPPANAEGVSHVITERGMVMSRTNGNVLSNREVRSPSHPYDTPFVHLDSLC